LPILNGCYEDLHVPEHFRKIARKIRREAKLVPGARDGWGWRVNEGRELHLRCGRLTPSAIRSSNHSVEEVNQHASLVKVS
jgi:hypothetical protein